MKRLLTTLGVAFFLLLLVADKLDSQVNTASYGTNVTSLSTSGTGAVTGTAFAIPAASSNIITWTVVANGSALSVNLEASPDNTNWSVVDSQTTAAGGIKNYGPTAIKFARCSQVSRTGGTSTTCVLTTGKGVYATVPSGSSTTFTGNRIRVEDGLVTAPSFSFTNETNTGWYRSGTGLLTATTAGTDRITVGCATSLIGIGGCTSSFPALKRSAAVLDIRLADDSNSANLTAGSITSSGNISAGSAGAFRFVSTVSMSAIAPTISSGFGTSPSVITPNGTTAFTINVGTGGTATSGVIGLTTAATGWNCYSTDITATAAHTALETRQIASTTTTATIESQNRATGAATAWAASSILRVSCFAY